MFNGRTSAYSPISIHRSVITVKKYKRQTMLYKQFPRRVHQTGERGVYVL